MAVPGRPIIVAATRKHTATVIIAHGLGDTGAGWTFLPENWRLRSKFEEVKFILPNAPSIPITCNGGMRMPGWYDIVRSRPNFSASELARFRLFDFSNLPLQVQFGALLTEQDEAGIVNSAKYMNSLIQQEIDAGIPADRIVLGGFSQGGATALFGGLTSPVKIGGIFGLSCYLPIHDKVHLHIPASKPNQDTPIFMGHGTADPVVQPPWGLVSAEILKASGYKVEYHTYKGLAHSAAPEEIDDLEAYLHKRIPALGDKPTL